jgi:hypothetical protein
MRCGLSRRGKDLVVRRLEESRVVDEGNVDPARVIGVGMDDGVVAPRQPASRTPTRRSTAKRFSTSQLPSRSGAGPAVQLRDHRGELGDLAVAARRRPASKVRANRALELLAPARRVLLIEETLQVPPGDVADRRHPHHSYSRLSRRQAPTHQERPQVGAPATTSGSIPAPTVPPLEVVGTGVAEAGGGSRPETGDPQLNGCASAKPVSAQQAELFDAASCGPLHKPSPWPVP